MAQLLLMGAQLACGLPGRQILGPVIASIIPVSPLNIICYLAWLIGLKLSPLKWSKKLAPTWRKAAMWAAVFYFCTMLPLYFIILLIVCRAAG